MNTGTVGRYQKQNGNEEIRIHFVCWALPNGRELNHVSIFPHACKKCVGGDHTHIEINDDRKPIEIIKEGVVFSPAHKKAMDCYLLEKLAINNITHDLLEYVT